MNNLPENEGIRINKYLSDSGICSRREADREIEMGNVTIDGRIADMGDRVLPGQKVLFKGIPAEIEEERILLVFNKPVGIVCTAEKREKDNVIDYINYPKRIYPVGRLDKDSEGLLLLTNQGEIVNKMMRAGNMHEKEYIVTLWNPVPDSLLRGLAGGVPLVELGVTTRECFVERIDKFSFRIILTQGYNRQIRRMCEYFGYHVKSLKRVRIMNIELGDLAPGQYRDVTESEYHVLMRLIRDSSNTTVKDAPRKRFKTEKVQGMVDRELARRDERGVRKPDGGRRYPDDRRPGEDRRPVGTGRPDENRRPAGAGRLGEDRRPAGTGRSSEDRRLAGAGRPGEDRRPAGAGRLGEDRRPVDAGRPAGTGRGDSERRFSENRRPDSERRFRDDRKPSGEHGFNDDRRSSGEHKFNNDRGAAGEHKFNNDRRPNDNRNFSDDRRTNRDDSMTGGRENRRYDRSNAAGSANRRPGGAPQTQHIPPQNQHNASQTPRIPSQNQHNASQAPRIPSQNQHNASQAPRIPSQTQHISSQHPQHTETSAASVRSGRPIQNSPENGSKPAKTVFVSNGSYSQSAAFEERQRQKAARKAARESAKESADRNRPGSEGPDSDGRPGN